MKHVLVVHPQFNVLGGAELAALRVVDWLVNKCGVRVSLLAVQETDVRQLQARSGLIFPEGTVTTLVAPCPRWIRVREGSFHLLKLGYLNRAAKKVARDFDLCVSTYNEADFGLPGFQYVHHPNFLPRQVLHRFHMIGQRSILDSSPMFEHIYRAAVNRISGNTIEGYRKNRTAVSSEFMHEIFREEYGIESSILYPTFYPNAVQGEEIPWEARERRFVSVGRFSPDKNLLELVDLYAHLRDWSPDAAFMIVGRISDNNYYQQVLSKAGSVGVPIDIRTEVNDGEIVEILGKSKYYIGPKKFEHFGLSVLDAAYAGCLTFVHDSGGQREIITPQELRYATHEDLVKKVSMLDNDKPLRDNVLNEMSRGISKLRLDDFYNNLSSILMPLLK